MTEKSKQQLLDELDAIRQEHDTLYRDAGKKVGGLLCAFSRAVQIVNGVCAGQCGVLDINPVLALVVMLFFSEAEQFTDLDLSSTIADTDNMGFDEVTAISIVQKIPLFRKTVQIRNAGASDAEIIGYIQRWHKGGTHKQ